MSRISDPKKPPAEAIQHALIALIALIALTTIYRPRPPQTAI